MRQTLSGEDIKEKVRRIGLHRAGRLGRLQRDIARWASAVQSLRLQEQ